MKNLSVLTWIFLASLLASSAHAQDKQKSVLNRCEGTNKKTEVVIKTIQTPYSIKNNLSTSVLNHKGKVSYSGEYVLGLTSLQKRTVIEFDGPVWQDKQTGGECFAPLISVQLHYDPMTVHIGSEFAPDTCIYNLVLEHEKQHVRIYQENFPIIESTIRQLMEMRFAGKPIYAPSGQARSLLADEIDQLWRPLIKSELSKVEIEQNKVDSEEKIAELSWGCLGEVQVLFGGGSRHYKIY